MRRAEHGLERLGHLLSALLRTPDDVHFPRGAEFDTVLCGTHSNIRRQPIAGVRSLPTDVGVATLGRHSPARH
jgi:hypothetical protein